MKHIKYLFIFLTLGFFTLTFHTSLVQADHNAFHTCNTNSGGDGSLCACLPGDGNADKPSCAGKINVPQPKGALTSIPKIIEAGIKLIIIVAGLTAFVYLLLGGIKWITSGGDKGQVEAARGQIIQALIGLIVVLASWGIIVVVEQATGFGMGFSKPLDIPTFY